MLASTISALLAGGGAAHAQAPAQDPGLEEITVTGSRIVRRDLDAASPIVTIDTERLENSSTISIESVLNQMPQFVPEGTQFDQGIQASPTASLGIGSVNLRGIGANRTLVLVDGRRAQPANATLVIDVNSIPSAAIERVETITGGASAVYGADALAGVVNFILKDDFEGVEMDLQTGTTQEGDGSETRFTSLLGVNSGDGDGNVMLGVEWYNRGGVMARDREFYMNGWFDPSSDAGGFLQPAGYSPATTGILPAQSAVDQIFAAVPGYFPGGGPAPAGQFSVNNRTEIYFNPDGSPFVLAGARGYNGPMGSTATGDGFSGMRLQPNGNLGQVFYEAQASTPLQRRAAFGRATTDINDNLSAFVQANYTSVEVKTTGGFPPAITVWSAPIPNDGRPQVPAALQTLLNSRFTPDPDGPGPLTAGAPGSAASTDWTLFRVLDFLGGPVKPVSSTDVWQIMAGVEGAFTNRDWTWEAYVSTGETDTLNFNTNLPSLQRYQYLVRQPNFGVGSFTQGRNYVINCPTGLPIFRTTDPDQRCLEGIDSKGRSVTTVAQNIAEFNLQGKIADMRAGELRFAAGVSGRENSFQFDPSETNDNVSTVENPIGIFAGNNTLGSTEVKELYSELLVPLTERLDLELGYRLSDYDNAAGEVNTYKSLFTWRAGDSVTLRGGYQLAERAPNTAELFQGPSLLVVGFAPSDPCSFTTTVPWGNVATSSNRLAVQTLCAAIINNSDTDITNNNTSAFGLPGSAQADAFARPGIPFFPLEIEVRQGSTDVRSEEAKTWTLGVVFQPSGLDGLTASIDLYNIEIADAIAPVNSLFVYGQCFNANGSSNPGLDPSNQFCRMIRRNTSTGERAEVDAPFANTGLLETTGLDLAVNWTTDIGSAGSSLYVNTLLTYLDRYEIQDAPGTPIVDATDTLDQGGQFQYKLTSTLGYNFSGGRTNVGLQWRHLPSIRDESAARNPATNVSSVPSYNSFNLFAGFSINERISFRGGIDNLLDEQPHIVGSRPGDRNAEVTRPDYYDVLGRRGYVAVKVAF
jgi:outer membrane receptor protein involved in Fe transport